MSMITGVGDEVVEVTCVLLATAVAALAWWSTAARPDRFRTVIVMERTTRGTPQNLTSTLAGRNISNIRRNLMRGSAAVANTPADPVPTDIREDADSIASESDASDSDGLLRRTSEGEAAEAVAGSDQAQEMDRIVSAMDANIDVLSGRRFNFITRTSGGTSTISTAEVPSSHKEPSETQRDTNANTSTLQNITEQSARETNANDTADETHTETESKENTTAISENTQKINIKLKHLNDSFREVDGSLDELLKDFKWRHFATELSQQLRLLLIFNGHVLTEDASTLRACGLYHNCVVHCLVHPPRQRSPATAEVVPSLLEAAGVAAVGGLDGEPTAPVQPAAAEARAWDLENVLMTLVSIILTVIWFFRCEYSNIFTASASGALFALTVFYSVAIFGLYFSDTFHLTNRLPRDEPGQRPRVPAYL